MSTRAGLHARMPDTYTRIECIYTPERELVRMCVCVFVCVRTIMCARGLCRGRLNRRELEPSSQLRVGDKATALARGCLPESRVEHPQVDVGNRHRNHEHGEAHLSADKTRDGKHHTHAGTHKIRNEKVRMVRRGEEGEAAASGTVCGRARAAMQLGVACGRT